jgi:hypothetical protein
MRAMNAFDLAPFQGSSQGRYGSQGYNPGLQSSCPFGTKNRRTIPNSTLTFAPFNPGGFIHNLWAGIKHRSMLWMDTGRKPMLGYIALRSVER